MVRRSDFFVKICSEWLWQSIMMLEFLRKWFQLVFKALSGV